MSACSSSSYSYPKARLARLTHAAVACFGCDRSVSSVGIQMEGDCDMEKLNGWLSQLLQV